MLQVKTDRWEPAQVGLLVACSHQKVADPLPKLQARSLPTGPIDERAMAWIDRLAVIKGQYPARLLYRGVYWSGVTGLWSRTSNRWPSAPLWILSAGYGLIEASATIAPYSATLSPGQEDSVSPKGPANDRGTWWNCISSWSGPQPGMPRSLPELILQFPDTVWLLVAGEHYIRVLVSELSSAGEQDGHLRRFVLVSPGLSSRRRLPHVIEHTLVRADARWESELGTGMVPLGIRIATHLFDLADGTPGALWAAAHAMQVKGQHMNRRPRPQRAVRSDAEVTAFIRTLRAATPGMSFTTALRQFRESGLACEYKRFRSLFNDLEEASVGSPS